MDTPQPKRTSRSFPIFEQASSELLDKLREFRGQEARKLANEARHLLFVFRRWADEPPSDDERVRTIQELLDFSRTANEWLAARKRS